MNDNNPNIKKKHPHQSNKSPGRVWYELEHKRGLLGNYNNAVTRENILLNVCPSRREKQNYIPTRYNCWLQSKNG